MFIFQNWPRTYYKNKTKDECRIERKKPNHKQTQETRQKISEAIKKRNKFNIELMLNV